MIICGLDTETTGLNIEKDGIVEIGAVLWDTETNTPIKFFNEFILNEDIPMSPEASAVNGITQDFLNKWGKSSMVVYRELNRFLEDCDYILAHNGLGYDKPILENNMKRNAITLLEKPWVDSRIHIDYPKSFTSKRLIHLAADLGFVNPFAHRAVTDVLTMLRVASHYNWDETVKNSQGNLVMIRAMVTREEKDKAKVLGYQWNNEAKIWYKNVMDHKVDKERELANGQFQVVEIKS